MTWKRNKHKPKAICQQYRDREGVRGRRCGEGGEGRDGGEVPGVLPLLVEGRVGVIILVDSTVLDAGLPPRAVKLRK